MGNLFSSRRSTTTAPATINKVAPPTVTAPAAPVELPKAVADTPNVDEEYNNYEDEETKQWYDNYRNYPFSDRWDGRYVKREEGEKSN